MKSKQNKTFVTQPFLPPLKVFNKYVKQIWENKYLTNNGPFVNRLEYELKKFLNVKHLFFVANGTIALQLAIKALKLSGEIITTPFSFVASTSSIVWEGLKPVFVDIDSNTLNIDTKKIEDKITSNTSCILVPHVFGIPNNVICIKEIALKYNLKIIYDAAHAFGVDYLGKSLVSYGDVSTLSFHATKLFHTAEGGAIITNDDYIAKKIRLSREFGYDKKSSYKVFSLGINGKNSELHAALGLSILPNIHYILKERENIFNQYKYFLGDLGLKSFTIPPKTKYNYHYYPLIFKTQKILLKTITLLEKNNIFPKRYFYPSLNTLNYVIKQKTPIATSISERIICLPLYVGLKKEKIRQICDIIRYCV